MNILFYFLIYLFIFILINLFFTYKYSNNPNNLNLNPNPNKETFYSSSNSADFCNFFGLGSIFKSRSSTNSNVYECGQEEICSCARENEKCLVDAEGNNTCCNNLNCVRLKGEFGYKVCSTKQDACGYYRNDYLKYLFDEEAWESIFNEIEDYFTSKSSYSYVEEENGETSQILNNKRKDILDFIKVRGLCGEKYSAQDIRKQLDDFFTKDQIFSDLIYGVEKAFNNLPSSNTTSGSNNRNCKYTNDTIDNY